MCLKLEKKICLAYILQEYVNISIYPGAKRVSFA